MRVLNGAMPISALGRSSALTHELKTTDAVVRMPLPLSRRLGIVHLRGGVGASALTASIANVFARRRPGMVLAVDAAAVQTSAMLWHAGLAVHTEHTRSELRARAHSAADARDGLPRTPSGAYALDLRALRDAPGRPDTDDWQREVDPISRFFEVVVTDWGTRLPSLDLSRVATVSHGLCVVARADRASVDEAAAIIPAIRAQPGAPGVTLAVVDVTGNGSRSAQALMEGLDVPVVRIPHDRMRASARPVGSRSLAAATRIAHARLAASVLRSSLEEANA